MEFSEVVALFLRRKWLVVSILAATVIINVALLRMQPVYYSVHSKLQVNSQTPASFSSEAIDSIQIFDPFTMGVFYELVDGPSLDNLVEKFLLRDGKEELVDQWRREELKIETAGSEMQSTFLIVSYIHENSVVAGDLLKAAVFAIQEISQQHFTKSVNDGQLKFESMVNSSHEVLLKLQGLISQGMKDADLPESVENIDSVLNSLRLQNQKFETTLPEIEAEIEASRQQLQSYVAKLAKGDIGFSAQLPREVDSPIKLLPYVREHPVGDVIMTSINEMTDALSVMEEVANSKTEKHPDYIAAKKAFSRWERKYNSFLNPSGGLLSELIDEALSTHFGKVSVEQKKIANDLLKAEARLEATQRLYSKNEAKIQKIQKYVAPIGLLNRERSQQEEVHSSLRKTLAALMSAESLAPEVVKIFEEAREPVRVAKLLENYFMIVVLLGVILSIGAAYGAETFDHRIHNQHTLRKHTNMPTIGIIPDMGGEADLLPITGYSTPGVEAFNTILKKVLVGLGEGKVLQVTGPGPAVGKTLVSTQLAMAAARLGVRTLLLDGDLRQPRVHDVFGINRFPGFLELLNGTEQHRRSAFERQMAEEGLGQTNLRLRPSEIARFSAGAELAHIGGELGAYGGCARDVGYSNLTVVPAGPEPEDPAQVYNSLEMHEFLRQARSEFQLIILDTPPLNVVSDALLLSERVDGNLMVVMAGKTRSQELHWARQSLLDVGAPMLGIVLNGLKHRAPGYYSYYYGKKYYRARV